MARLVLMVHLGFILYVVFGGFLVRRYEWTLWVHLPVVVWGAGISFFGWTCPLTPLEKFFLEQANYPAYSGSFIEHYLLSAVYPEGLTRTHQILLGVFVLAVNGLAYGCWLNRRS